MILYPHRFNQRRQVAARRDFAVVGMDVQITALWQLRQVRQALGRDMSRVQRFFIATSGSPDTGLISSTHPDLIVIDSSATASGRVLTTLGTYNEADVFVVDPLGNIMLRFPAGTSMKDMHKDLSLLLKASTIG